MDMIERVAIAIDQAVATWQPGSCMGSIKLMAARAAIEAMREPTDRMCAAGAAKWDDDWCSETNALNMWNGMIDAALVSHKP